MKLMKHLFENWRPKPADPVKKALKDEKIMKNIFSYLSAKDVLRCTEVMKDWNTFVGRSDNCMDRMRFLVLQPHPGMIWPFTPNDIKGLLNNGRNYKHIGIYTTRSFTEEHLLLMASFKWKTMFLYHHTFRSEIELVNFLGHVEPTVEKLDLRCIKIVFSKQNDIADCNFKFPKLKWLKLYCCYSYIISDILKNITTLEHFEIETIAPPMYHNERLVIERRANALKVIFVNNPKLNSLFLYLNQKDFDGLFFDNRYLSFVKFKLETLKLKNFKKLFGEVKNTQQIKNFSVFLKSQQITLKLLYMYEWIGTESLETVINSLDNLKKLLICDLDCYGKNEESLANSDFYINESIETLSIYSKHSKYINLTRLLLGVVPNLKHLNIDTVNQQILNLLIDETDHLECINVDYFTAYDPPSGAVLNCLKHITINVSYANNFKDLLMCFSACTNFKNIFLKAVRKFDERAEQL